MENQIGLFWGKKTVRIQFKWFFSMLQDQMEFETGLLLKRSILSFHQILQDEESLGEVFSFLFCVATQ